MAVTVEAYFAKKPSDAGLRPIITSLNGDNSWLISYPRPLSEKAATGSAFFHVVSDPWLTGPAITFSSWVISVNHHVTPAVRSADGIVPIIQDIERRAGSAAYASAGVNAVFVLFSLSDHMHQDTLTGFPSSTPVFAVADAAPTIQGWKHFEQVVTIHDYESDSSWRDHHPGSVLPSWLTIVRFPASDLLNIGTVTVWSPTDDKNEVVFYSPHGYHVQPTPPVLFTQFLSSSPSLEFLAIMHPLKESFAAGKQTVFGVSNGLELQRHTKAKYWVDTGDAPLGYTGVISWIVRDVFRTLEWGLDQARDSGKTEKPNFVEVDNGACFILE